MYHHPDILGELVADRRARLATAARRPRRARTDARRSRSRATAGGAGSAVLAFAGLGRFRRRPCLDCG